MYHLLWWKTGLQKGECSIYEPQQLFEAIIHSILVFHQNCTIITLVAWVWLMNHTCRW